MLFVEMEIKFGRTRDRVIWKRFDGNNNNN